MEVRSATWVSRPRTGADHRSPRATLASHSCRKAPLPVFTSSTSPSRGFLRDLLAHDRARDERSDSVLPPVVHNNRNGVFVCVCVCVRERERREVGTGVVGES